MKNKYQVIIIGAGPAGISTALNLYELGIKDILVVEKYKYPRYKCCAGYITNKTKKEYERLGLNIDKCHYSLIKDFKLFYKGKVKQKIINKFLYTNRKIDRVELDYEFFKLLKTKKIRVLENTSIKDHLMSDNKVILANDKTYYYDYLIFADGTNSYGKKYQKDFKKHLAMQMTFKSKKDDEIQIHFGYSKKGYVWISSYQGITNVGLTDVYNKKTNYQELFKRILRENGFKEDTKELKGTFTPIGIRKPIINNNVFFVGDAVGACDPLTLSGLKYALQTGKYTALAIKDNNNKIYLKYINNLRFKFSFMLILLHIFYLKFTLFCVFEIGCRFFGKIIDFAFNNFFINKK